MVIGFGIVIVVIFVIFVKCFLKFWFVWVIGILIVFEIGMFINVGN